MKTVLILPLLLLSISLKAGYFNIFKKSIAVNDISYIYYDGARNKYILHGDTIEYIPVKSIETSSGTYDGGNYSKKEILPTERDKLLLLFKKAKRDKKAQTDKNIKPNAAIEIKTGNKETSFLLKATSEINFKIIMLLQQLLHQ